MSTKMQQDFKKYHAENPHIYAAYLEYANQLHNVDIKDKSISMITALIHWQTATRGTGEFKIQNT